MRKQSIMFVIAAVAVAGCVQTRIVDLTDSADPVYAEVNSGNAHRVKIVVDGIAHSAEYQLVRPDSTFWIDANTGARQIVATGTITEIRLTTRDKRRATIGRRVGLLAGVVLGASLGFRAGDTTCPPTYGLDFSCIEFRARTKAAFGGSVFGMLGNMMGHGLSGKTYRYRVRRQPSVESVAVIDY